MKPAYKTPGMNAALANLGINRELIKDDICLSCKQPAKTFKDALSRKEYSISGLCQSCQDLVFKEDE